MTVIIILLIILFLIWAFSGSNSSKTNSSNSQNNSTYTTEYNDTFKKFQRKLEEDKKEKEIERQKQIRIEKEKQKTNEIKRIHNQDKEPSKEIILSRYGINYFYHMTHKNNLKGILEKGLYSHNYAHSKGLTRQSIANNDVVSRRSLKNDPINHLSINDYAPLYFNPKNPMLYVKSDIEDDLVIIAFDRSIIYYPNTVFTDGNAANNSTKFYNSLNDLNKLNWDCLNAEYWSDFIDGKRQRMAEVLVKSMIPNTKIRKLYCNNQNTFSFVMNLSENYDYITVELKSSLFFNKRNNSGFSNFYNSSFDDDFNLPF